MPKPRLAHCRTCDKDTLHTLEEERNPDSGYLVRFRVCGECFTRNPLGVCCPECWSTRLKTLATRQRREFTVRHKVCRNCSKRFRTREVIESFSA